MEKDGKRQWSSTAKNQTFKNTTKKKILSVTVSSSETRFVSFSQEK